MAKSGAWRRRPSAQISLTRAARLHRMVRFLAVEPRPRAALLETVGVGLRTFYRELGLLRRHGLKIRLRDGLYVLAQTVEEAEGFLPIPDPQLRFAELVELSQGSGTAARRLAGLLEAVTSQAAQPEKTKPRKQRPRKGN